MRENKFRAWDKGLNRMISWNQILNNLIEGRHIVSCTYDPLNNDKLLIPMQFTGLLDRQGKEIYEGDWFQSGSRVNPFIIVWCNGSFRGKYPQHDGEGFHIDNYETKYGEVIGNIYEHPELIEDGK